jgi:hypothetical protein
MAETEAPASRRKPPETATPSTYSHRARRRLYPLPGTHRALTIATLLSRGVPGEVPGASTRGTSFACGIMKPMKTFTAVVEKDSDTDLYVGYVPSFPGALEAFEGELRQVKARFRQETSSQPDGF